MTRLVDYFVVVGYNYDKQRGSSSEGKILQRFPETDWPDTPFMDGLSLFCQPHGWRLNSIQQAPSFFTSVLTDIKASNHYCAVLSFFEEAQIQPSKHCHDEELYMEGIDDYDEPHIDLSNGAIQCTMYAPKCLVLVSQHFYLKTLKNCLSLLYSAFVDGSTTPLERLVGNLLACVEIPAGIPREISFSLGSDDEYHLRPVSSETVPYSATCVHNLFQDLGIHASIRLFEAVMTDNRILFHSRSYSRLHDACHSLITLMYPFKYIHVYIPVLPTSIFEVLSTPTPFLIGVHSSLKNEVSDILDVIIVDLDGGHIAVPDSIHIPRLDEVTLNELLTLLCSVIRPSLNHADDAFQVQPIVSSPPEILDKEIRAIFLRLFTHLLSGYRQCLQSVRIHPKPYITFQKSLFLGQRNLIDNEFLVKILDSMYFNSFVQERGLPFRSVDLFDDLYSQLETFVKRETSGGIDVVLDNIKIIAQRLADNEGIETCSVTCHPHSELASRTFPHLNSQEITRIIECEQITKEIGEQSPPINRSTSCTSSSESSNNYLSTHPLSPLTRGGSSVPQIVPLGPSTTLISCVASSTTNSARRLEVMKSCIKAIFENRISDAKKIFPAVTRALRNNSACLSLAHELSIYVTGPKAQLDHQQFDLIVKLINCALQQESDSLGGTAAGNSGYEDVNGVAAAMLPLAANLCRRLSPHALQFAYTCIQDHAIWSNQNFWEYTFYRDVSRDICALYSIDNCQEQFNSLGNDITDQLAIVAQQLQLVYEGKLSETDLIDAGKNEDRTVFSQAAHFANRIVYLKIPLDIGFAEKASRSILGATGEAASDSNSEAWARDSWRGESSAVPGHVVHSEIGGGRDDESGFEEDRSGSNGNRHKVHSETGNHAIKMTARFVDKVCCECGLPEEDIKSLHQLIPGVVAMQIETLEIVYKESKNLPPISKPKILTPHLLPGEEVTVDGLRVFLFPDGRDEVITSGGKHTSSISQAIGPALLPAEGAIFLTNYRIIFRGTPIDPFYSECSIFRSFPISTLTKEKKISLPSNYLLSTLDHLSHEGLQLRSNTFQMMRIAFDDEVSLDTIDKFKKFVNKARCPSDIFTYFAFTSQVSTASQQKCIDRHKNKDKNSTLKNITKKTLRGAANFTGIRYKPNKNRKYLVDSINQSIGQPSDLRVASAGDSIISATGTLVDTSHNVNRVSSSTLPHVVASNVSVSGVSPLHHFTQKERDINEIHTLTDLPYFKDYIRMDLGSPKDIFSSTGQLKSPKLQSPPGDSFRISYVNINYGLVKSYPSFIVVPRGITDENLKKLSRGHRQGRFPCITWKHPLKHSLLLRGSSFYGKGVAGMLRGHTSTSVVTGTTASTSMTTAGESSYAIEQEKYFRSLIKLTPAHFLRSNVQSSMSTHTVPESPGHNSSMKRDSLIESPRTKYNSTLSKTLRSTLRNSGGKGSLASFGNSFGKQLSKLTHSQKGSKAKSSTVTPSAPVAYSTASGSSTPPPLPPPPASSSSTATATICNSSTTMSLSSTLPSSTSSHFTSSNFTNSSKSSLYVIGEKSQVKGIHKDQFPNCDFIPVDIHEVKSVKQSFKKLIKACTPSVATTDPDISLYKLLRNSEWYTQIQTVMQVSSVIVDLIDIQGSSVMVCLEDGWDIVPQIISIAQLCLDPYYRTFTGFRTLIEKEWLSFGHRFSYRSNHTAATLTSGFAPVFLQFLDIVHQIMLQYPLSFEFNEYYLKFLAYHYVSCRFRTFMLDCEQERAELAWLLDDLKQVDDSYDEYDDDDTVSTVSASTTSASHGVSYNLASGTTTGFNVDRFNFTGTSFWRYAEMAWNKSPIFYNFLYEATTIHDGHLKVLRPSNNIAILELWDYYCEEHLAYGYSYDLELVKMEKQSREENEATKDTTTADRNKSNRDICNSGYHSVIHQQPSAIATLLDQLRKLDVTMSSTTNHTWLNIWNKIEIPMMSTTSLGATAQSKNIDSFARLGCLSTYQGYTGTALGSKVKTPSSFATLRKQFLDQGKRTLKRNGTSGHISPVLANAD